MTVTDRLRSAGATAVAALFPACCLACDRTTRERELELGLCSACAATLVGLGDSACPLCARPLAATDLPPGFRCGACRRRPPTWDRLFARWSYEPPLDAVVQALKYRGYEFLGRHLALGLVERVGGRPAPDLVVAVPLHWRRHLARGYNQAERIARPLAAAIGRPLAAPLRRVRATPPQTRRSRRERRKNLRRAFRPRRRVPVRGRRILLVDDVMTTGATLEAAARCLKRGGAARVWAAVAGRTPLPGEAPILPRGRPER